MVKTKVFLTKEQKAEQIKAVKAIEDLLPKISEQIKNFHAKACVGAFQNSVDNLIKKCEIYNKEKVDVSPDEKKIMQDAAKKALAEFRSQKEKKISTDGETNNSTEIDEPITEISENPMGKKKGVKKH